MPLRANVAAMQAYVPGEQPSDSRIIKLNTNENPYPPSQQVFRTLENFDPCDLSRYPDPRCTALRSALAEVHGVQPEQLFVGNGSDEVLALCLRAFVENNGTVGFFDPSYSLYPVLCDIQQLTTRPIEQALDGTWSDPDPELDLFFLTRPNAPTGHAAPLENVRRYCHACRGIVVLDEAYAEFADDNGLEILGDCDNLIITRSFSKSYSLAGLRVGYAIGPKSLIDALLKIKDSYNVDRLAQVLARAAVLDQEHLRENITRIRATRERCAQALHEKGCTVTPSQANFLWIRTPIPAPLVFQKLRSHNILVRYFPGPKTGDYLRITIGTDTQMDALLALF